MDYKKISQEVLANVGGKENVKGATHCVTRLRLILEDETKYNRKALEKIDGVKGVIYNSGQLMIIFGTGTVNNVYDAFIEVTGVKELSQADAKAEGLSKAGKLKQGFKVFSDIFIPIIPAFISAAIIIGVRALLTANGMFGLEGSLADSNPLIKDIAEFLGLIATTFAFLPVLVMYSAVKRFGGNPILGILVGIVMVHPSLGDRGAFILDPSTADYWHFGPIEIAKVAFQGGVFPAILTALFMSYVEKVAQKYIPAVVSFVFVPTVTVLFANIALFTVFGPVGNAIGNGLAAVINFLYNGLGPIGAFIFAALLQPLVVTGTHQAIQGIEANLIATTGFNYIQAIWSVSIIAQGGAALGMYFIAKKNSRDREIAMSSFVPTLVGVTEPAIFAVNLKYSLIPFILGCIGAGFGGAFMKLMDVKAIGQALTVVLGVLIVVPEKLVLYIVGNLIAFVISLVLVIAYDKIKGVPKDEDEDDEAVEAVEVAAPAVENDGKVRAAVSGKAIAIEEVNDGVFSAKTLGDGIGIIPSSETVVAPVSGKVSVLMDGSKHAIGIKADDGSDYLIHVGIDTVNMNGDGFKYLVNANEKITAGQPLLKFDVKKIKDNGYNPVVLLIQTAAGSKGAVNFKSGFDVTAGKDVVGE